MIETLNSIIASDIRNLYLSYLDKNTREENSTISVNHFGVFSQDFINGIASNVEDMMVSFGEQKKIIKRAFSILIEGLQNIRLHASKDDFGRQLGFLFLFKSKQSYKIVLGNIVLNDAVDALVSYLENINQLEKEDLKEMYYKILTDGYLSQSGSAGLGFLLVRMKSENPLHFNIETMDDKKSLFTVEVVLNR
jgi:phosphotransferase system IIB component